MILQPQGMSMANTIPSRQPCQCPQSHQGDYASCARGFLRRTLLRFTPSFLEDAGQMTEAESLLVERSHPRLGNIGALSPHVTMIPG